MLAAGGLKAHMHKNPAELQTSFFPISKWLLFHNCIVFPNCMERSLLQAWSLERALTCHTLAADTLCVYMCVCMCVNVCMCVCDMRPLSVCCLTCSHAPVVCLLPYMLTCRHLLWAWAHTRVLTLTQRWHGAATLGLSALSRKTACCYRWRSVLDFAVRSNNRHCEV